MSLSWLGNTLQLQLDTRSMSRCDVVDLAVNVNTAEQHHHLGSGRQLVGRSLVAKERDPTSQPWVGVRRMRGNRHAPFSAENPRGARADRRPGSCFKRVVTHSLSAVCRIGE